MTIEELHQTLVDGLRSVDERFVGNDKRFDGIDGRFDGIDGRLDGIDGRLDGIDKRFDSIDGRLETIDARFVELRSDLEARIKEEGETTRRHFNVMVEKVEAAVRIVAEGHVHLKTIVDNHEVRLQTIERGT